MTLGLKNPAVVAGLLISLFAGLVAALLWLMPRPYTRLEFMIAGSAATALTLLVAFCVLTPGVQVTFRRLFRKNGSEETMPRTVRRSEQSS